MAHADHEPSDRRDLNRTAQALPVGIEPTLSGGVLPYPLWALGMVEHCQPQLRERALALFARLGPDAPEPYYGMGSYEGDDLMLHWRTVSGQRLDLELTPSSDHLHWATPTPEYRFHFTRRPAAALPDVMAGLTPPFRRPPQLG